jgi:hypothetical protein
MIIGAHRLDDQTLRLHVYSPVESTAAFAFDSERFAAHERFFDVTARLPYPSSLPRPYLLETHRPIADGRVLPARASQPLQQRG